MAIAEQDLDSETFTSTNPATGAVVGAFPVDDVVSVNDAVARAQPAAQWWAGLGFEGRKQRLLAFKGVIARRAEELADLMRRETGKPAEDAFLETVLAIDHLDWAARNAKRVLRRRRVRTSLLMANHGALLEYQPFGVVGIIGPWNYPVHTPMGSISYALAAGNAVVYKPSEYTPAVGQWLVEAFRAVVAEQPVFQQVTGFGETGHALCTADIGKLAFTGSARTGRKVMAACAENLTPVLMECGGKDAMIVADDADVDEAAHAAVWGGFQHAGQACISIERVFVTERVYEPFVAKVAELTGNVRVGGETDASYGPMTMPEQADVVRDHLEDALAKGGRALTGGPNAVREPYIDPVVLVDLPDDAKALREETFGPTLPVVRVADVDEAVERANATDYGLGSAVFSKRHGVAIASRLQAGMTSVNGVTTYAAIPSLPFGGSGESGFGRIHGDDGLREFSQAKGIAVKRFPGPNAFDFDRPDWLTPLLKTTTRVLHGRH